MRLEALQRTRAPLVESLAPHWRAPLLRLSLLWLACFALFARDWAAMVMQWWDSSTYNHVLFVPAILGWLVWQCAPELAHLTPRACWPGLALFAGALLLWLLGDAAGLATASQLGAVMMVQAGVLAVLGPRVAWALLFPLGYALFLVPVGDELVPALQLITAKITIALTHASGIPAHIEGVFIDTPAGLFEVAEACSGVKFLVAMVALGTLVSHVFFRSWSRRAAFMALAVVLPILANGVRAWGTIYLAQSQGIGFAAGFDHIFYGWIFFALVMAAVLAIGWRWFDRAPGDRFIDGAAIATDPRFALLERWSGRGWPTLAAALGMALAITSWAGVSRAMEADLSSDTAFASVPGWTPVAAEQAYPWQPMAGGADRVTTMAFRDGEGRVVEAVLALYAAQGEGREAGAFGQGALPADTEWRWHSGTSAPDGTPGERLQAMGVHRRVAETWYATGDWAGTSRLQLKLRSLRDRLLLRARPTAMLILSAEERPGTDPAAAIADFRAAAGGAGEWMDRTGGLD